MIFFLIYEIDYNWQTTFDISLRNQYFINKIVNTEQILPRVVAAKLFVSSSSLLKRPRTESKSFLSSDRSQTRANSPIERRLSCCRRTSRLTSSF